MHLRRPSTVVLKPSGMTAVVKVRQLLAVKWGNWNVYLTTVLDMKFTAGFVDCIFA